MSLSMFTMFRAEGTSYAPSLGKAAIAFAIPATAVLWYLFFAENLSILGEQDEVESEALEPAFGGAGIIPVLNTGIQGIVAHRSGFAIFVIALILPALSLQSSQPPHRSHPRLVGKRCTLTEINPDM